MTGPPLEAGYREALQHMSMDDASPNGRSDPMPRTPAEEYPLVSDVELEQQPDPVFVVDGVIIKGDLAVLWGPSGSFKSFEAIHLAGCVATGMVWHGHEVRLRGRVVIVVAEGASGTKKRIRAWKTANGYHGRSIDVRVLRRGVSLLDARAMRRFAESVRAHGPAPVLVIVDTLAGCFFEGDENDTGDMTRAVAALQELSRRLEDASVLVLHHCGWEKKDRMRGSYTLYAAADLVVKMSAEGHDLTLDCAPPGGKNPRDFEPFTMIRCAAVPSGDSFAIGITDGVIPSPEDLNANERSAIEELSRGFFEEGASFTEWRKASKVPEGSFPRARKSLCDRGLVERFRHGKSERYRVTTLGQTVLAINYQRGIRKLSLDRPEAAIALSPPITKYRGDSRSTGDSDAAAEIDLLYECDEAIGKRVDR